MSSRSEILKEISTAKIAIVVSHMSLAGNWDGDGGVLPVEVSTMFRNQITLSENELRQYESLLRSAKANSMARSTVDIQEEINLCEQIIGDVENRIREMNESEYGRSLPSHIQDGYRAIILYFTNELTDLIAESSKSQLSEAEPNDQHIERFKLAERFKGCVSVESTHTICVKADGTVFATDHNPYGQCDVGTWRNIVAVSTEYTYTLGLKSDGTVVCASRDNGRLKKEIANWRGIVAISASGDHALGLKEDGTVVAWANEYAKGIFRIASSYAGYNKTKVENEFSGNASDVTNWRDIVDVVAAGYGYYPTSLGLKKDGTVVAVGHNEGGLFEIVSKWRNIVAIASHDERIVGLQRNGMVVSVDRKYEDRVAADGTSKDRVAVPVSDSYEVQDIVAITAYFGLKSDGTVVSLCDNKVVSGFNDIISIASHFNQIIGVKTDGTVVAAYTGADTHNGNFRGNGEVFMFYDVGPVVDEFRDLRERGKQQWLKNEQQFKIRKEKLRTKRFNERVESGKCGHCGGELKGFLFFKKKCKYCDVSK